VSRLGQRVGQSVGWMVLTKGGLRSLEFAQWVVLARWLRPEEFGLLGLVMFSYLVIDTCLNPGLQVTLIQRQVLDHGLLSTAWVLGIARGVVLAALLWGGSAWISAFFSEPRLTGLLKVMSLSFVLGGLAHPGMAVLAKELKFSRYVMAESIGNIVMVLTTVWLAWSWRSVWAIVVGSLVGTTLRTAASFAVVRMPVSVRWHWREARSLWQFGRWVAVSNIAFFLFFYGDDAFVGKQLGTEALGYYSLAYKIAVLLVTQLMYDVSQVLYPAYTHLSATLPQLREAYCRILHGALVVACGYAALLWLMSQAATRHLLGTSWLPLVPLLRILCLMGVTRAAGAVTGPLFLAAGQPASQALLSVGQLGLMALTIAPFSRLQGVAGVAWSVLLASAVMQVGSLVWLARVRGLSITAMGSAWVQPLVVAGSCVLFIEGLAMRSLPIQTLGTAVCWSALFLMSYVAGLMLTGRWLPAALRGNLRWMLEAVRGP